VQLEQIAVVGAGTMGGGIAQVFVQHGLRVALYDADATALARGIANIGQRLEQQVEKGRLEASRCEQVLDGLSGIERLEQIGAADMVIEVVPERLDLKKEIFAQLDQYARADAILASNTSGLDLAQLAAVTGRPERVVGMHFFNPPPVMPLIEVVRHDTTAVEVLEAVQALAQRLGKTPIAVANSPGFVVNRILFPMINEAIYALAEGVATAADIDQAMQLGASHPIGPLALADFVGLDVTLDIIDSFEAAFGTAKYRACPLLREMVSRGELGRKSGKGFFSYG
jgi:3-hydroxybutyryl-CoA dehydrogenase